MKHYLPVTLLMLTITSGLAVAADPPAQSTPATPTSPIDPIDPGTDSKAKITGSTVNQSGPFPIITEGVIKPIQAVGAKTPKNADPGYTQIGNQFKIKFDRPKTELSLYENSLYSIHSGRADVSIFNPGSRLIQIKVTDRNGISFITIGPGTMTLTFVNDEGAEVKYYTVEVTILGDTRQLQSQLDQLYPRSSIEAIKIGESVLLRGTASKQEHIAEIIDIAEQYYPKALNQLKVAGVPVGQPLPGQPQVIRGYKSMGWTNNTISPATPIPASPASKIKKQITVQATVLEIDWKKLKETKLDLANTLHSFSIIPKQSGAGLYVVFPEQMTDGIVRLLTATKAVKVISRPVIRTLVGQPADIFIGEKTPLAEKKEIQNGKQVLETGYHNIGTALKLTPEPASHGGMKLSVLVEHKRRANDSIANTPEGHETANIYSHIFDTAVELKVGQATILSEPAPVSTNKKNPSADKGLMVILSTPEIGMTAKNVVWIPETTVKWIPGQNRFANVIRMVPKTILTKAGDKHGIRSDWISQNSPGVPQPNRTPNYADPTPATQPEPQDLRQSVRALRSDVRALRNDVKKLLTLLEDQTSAVPSAKPTVGAIHRRIKKSKTDLLVFHASWSSPCQKMESLLDDQANRGYSIRRLDINRYPELAKEFGVTSVPTIVAFANGKEDERWVGIIGKDALTRIVDKYAPRRTATWKGSRQLSETPAEHKIHEALKKEGSLELDQIPLHEAIRQISKKYDLNIVLDPRGLEEEGLEGTAPVTIHADGITLTSALKLILEPLRLAYQVRDEVLVITSRIRARGKLVVSTYSVADLVIPIPATGPIPINEDASNQSKKNEKAVSVTSRAIDFDALIEVIHSTVLPGSWEQVGGTGSIRPHKSTLSLVIRQSSEAHQEIENLLAQLRRLQDLQVTMESRFLDKLPEDIWKQLGIDFDSKKNTNGPLGGIILTDEQAELLQQAAQNDGRAKLMQGPKVTVFNGQTAGMTDSFSAGYWWQPLKHSLHVQPVISADRRNVRLNMRVSHRKSPGAETRAYVNTVPDGKVILIELVQWDANKVGVLKSENSRVIKNTSVPQTKGRHFFLIRPRIIVQEEEAILSPRPKLQSMLTPRGVIPEEEEKLLGIEKSE
ncbi:thioredoxin domain-containing protein [uncultured Gimesia sp.]|uniref:thioredoxin domain-containing protein n=1 Tax=uncultured Gimesia sp. TaxID=1678688 RepID=UPI002625635A|nr:thioredoxin domain-containing protein [uncultured Gimesia sp.]